MFRSSGSYNSRYPMFFYPFMGLLLAILCATLLSRVDLFGAWPDLITLYALFFTLHGNEKQRYVPCMVIGLMRDLLSAGPLGTYAILYGLMNRFLSPRRKSLYRENPITLTLVAIIVVASVNLSYHASLVLSGHGIGWSTALSRALTIGFITGPLMPVISYAMKWLLEKLEVERLPGANYNV